MALGTLYLQQQDTTRAESEFKKALDLDPKSSAVHFALGNLYWNISAMHLALGNVDWARYDLTQADQAFKTATESAPLRSAERLRYIDFQLQIGAVKEGKKALEEITRKAPDYLPAWVCLMKIAFEERRYEDCAVLVQNILTRDPVNYEALLQSGNPNDPVALSRLAAIQERDGAVEKAVKNYESALKLNPRNAQLMLKLAQLYSGRLNDPQKALGLAEGAHKLAPDDPSIS